MAFRKINELNTGNISVHIARDTNSGEYRARLFVDNKARENADYFTDNIDDAESTGRIMLAQCKS